MKTKPKQSTPKPTPRGRRPVISVIEMDIETAMTKKSGYCMVAEATKRAFPGITGVRVDVQTIRWSDKRKGLRYVYYTPPHVMAILIAWDQGIKPKPFTFKLRSPTITSMRVQVAPGTKKRKYAHKLGKKGPARNRKGERVTVVGGRSPPPMELIGGRDRLFGSHRLNHLLTPEELRGIQSVVQQPN